MALRIEMIIRTVTLQLGDASTLTIWVAAATPERIRFATSGGPIAPVGLNVLWDQADY